MSHNSFLCHFIYFCTSCWLLKPQKLEKCTAKRQSISHSMSNPSTSMVHISFPTTVLFLMFGGLIYSRSVFAWSKHDSLADTPYTKSFSFCTMNDKQSTTAIDTFAGCSSQKSVPFFFVFINSRTFRAILLNPAIFQNGNISPLQMHRTRI